MLDFVVTTLAIPDPYDRYFSPGFSTPGGFRSAPDILKGKRARIRKGTAIHSMHPQDSSEWFPLSRTTVITIFGSSQGYLTDSPRYNSPEYRAYRHAELVWPGSGGYWKRVRLRDVELLDATDPIVVPTTTEVAEFDHYLSSIFSPPATPVP
jgi:hypothetical protein